MGYPENALAQDEQLVLHRHPHWKKLFWPAVIFVLTSAAAGLLGGLINDQVDVAKTKLILSIAVGIIWAIIVGWLCVTPFISWLTTHFVITDRRVTFRNGILTRSGIDIPLARINSVQFRHGPIDRLLRTGTLIIESASDDPLEFNDIPAVEKVHSLLYHEVFDTLDGEEGDTRTSMHR
ncbi:MAG: PH domain-containing protein [Mycobacteriaceae bacterium]